MKTCLSLLHKEGRTFQEKAFVFFYRFKKVSFKINYNNSLFPKYNELECLPLHLSQTFGGKAVSWVTPLSSSLAWKYQTRTNVTDRGKRSSLLRCNNNCCIIKFWSTSHWQNWVNNNISMGINNSLLHSISYKISGQWLISNTYLYLSNLRNKHLRQNVFISVREPLLKGRPSTLDLLIKVVFSYAKAVVLGPVSYNLLRL